MLRPKSMNSSFFTVGPTGSPHETRIVWSFYSNYDFATQPMENRQVGLVLGLLVGGLVGSVCGLIVLTLPWSLVGAVIGGILGSILTARHRPSLRPFFGTVLGICGGILVLAFQRDQDHARVGAISGSLIGLIAGIGAWLALIGALNLMSKIPMEWGQSHDEHERFGGDDHGLGLRIERRCR